MNRVAPLPQYLVITWEDLVDDGEPGRRRATLCRLHRSQIAQEYPSARGCGQLGDSCDLCQGRPIGTLPPESA